MADAGYRRHIAAGIYGQCRGVVRADDSDGDLGKRQY